MKWLPMAFSLVALCLAAPASAKAPTEASTKPTVNISPGELSATPEMWFYEQAQRQYQDPKAGVRQKAEFRASERQRRLTALRWYGLSNTRPATCADPVHGDYGPAWVSGDMSHPTQWAGSAGTTVVVNPSANVSR